MKKTHYFIIDHKGIIVDYSMPFDIDLNVHIEQILPLYSSINSYQYLIDLVIEAYEFTYKNKQYIVDTILKKEVTGYRVILDDRTSVYRQKSKEQTEKNKLLIEQEYAELRHKYTATKNKYMDFVLSTIHQMVQDSHYKIKQSLESLSSVNTYVKDDQSKIDDIIKTIQGEITHIENSFTHSTVFNHIDPTTLLDNAEYINLNELVTEIKSEYSIEAGNIELVFPTGTIIYGNRMFYRNLLNYYFGKSEKVNNKIILRAEKCEGKLLNFKITYYLKLKEFRLPQEFVQTFKFPIDKKVESDKEIIEIVFKTLKNAILKQAYYINQIAA
jgi:hypothetical protein